MTPERRFSGRTAIVTGGGGDIGCAMVRRLSIEGAVVLVVDHTVEAVERGVNAAESAGGRAHGWLADVSVAGDVESYAAEAARIGRGEVHLFCNNAGIEGPVASVVDLEDADFDRVIAVNVRGVYLGLKHVLRFMPSGSAVVNTASVGALEGTAGFAPYAASKHAVLGLTRSVAKEQAPRGVRVNALCPGPVTGRMMASIEAGYDQETRDKFHASVPLGRYARTEEIAAAAAHLLSDEASYLVGVAHVVDGGWTA